MERVVSKNAHPQHRHHELFLRSRPYRGELPTVAGLLLYPDTPAKMETTAQEAFSFRPIPRQDAFTGEQKLHSPQQLTSSRKTGRNSRTDEEPQMCEQEGTDNHTHHDNRGNADLQSQYQKDFTPPSQCRRRTPALPQPDNIGINPAFRIEFRTVQRETYPSWPVMTRRLPGTRRAATSGQRKF
ncbi:uncharacterized protein si:dkeyp-69c1.9 [Thalassophryne amazonica]|uniref:uncharacterized protein si:dkeyp-69c1.9 n=1 Tax=Thalassophryne amazonica TaxID=390379 RepID=UPI001471DD3B|nr:uncharacterized protein si:dkeyp-69c1.9 [Thalassophryne amazonica]